MHRKDIVTSALGSFLALHLPQSSIGGIDDIVLNYLVGVLEDVGNEDEFDVEDFAEMMEAYIPGFKDITGDTICQWIFQLSGEVLSATYSLGTPPSSLSSVKENPPTKESLALLEDIDLPYSLPQSTNRQQQSISDSAQKGKKSECRNTVTNGPSPRNAEDKIKLLAEMFPDSCKVDVKRRLSESNGDVEQAVQAMLHSEGCNQTRNGSLKATCDQIGKQESALSSSSSSSLSDDNIQFLLEMFPSSSELQALQCLSIAKGDLGEASQVLLNLQESGKLEGQSSSVSLPIQKSSARNEMHVKESLLKKYGYIDTDEDRKNHKPMEPKKEKKKMVRYINSQTVTTKGEKFIESKKPESEEMKKTYCHLKAARKYHFH